MFKSSTLLLIAALLTGCANPVALQTTTQLDDSHRYSKNYNVGDSKIANVGDPIVRLQDFWVERSLAAVAIPDSDVSVSGGPVHIKITKGQRYPVRGDVVLDGVGYTMIGVPGQDGNRVVLIKSTGHLHNRTGGLLPQGLVLAVYQMEVSNPNVKFVRETTEVTKQSKGYENFELIYTGLNSSGLTLTYREFSPEGVARVAFFQNLTYETSAKIITFKKYRISIEEASSQFLRYTVLSDGR